MNANKFITRTFSLLTPFIFSSSLMGQEVSLVFFGDIMGHTPQIYSAKKINGSGYDYNNCFKYIEPYVRSADLSAGNLELTLAGEPYTGYPTFSSPDELVFALSNINVNVLVTANNHTCDRRKFGLERTIKILDENCFLRTGSFKDSSDLQNKHPLLLYANGVKLAILSYTYGTNGIPVTHPNIVNHINRDIMAADLEKTKVFNPDKIIAFLHWGEEYQTTPGTEQTELTKFLFNEGVDIIIGSHPHVLQPMHFYNEINFSEKVVVYSLGNFISNQRKPLTDGGAIVKISILKEGDKTMITGAEYLLTWVFTPFVNEKKQYYVLPASVYYKHGIPDGLPKGYNGMFDYLKLAGEIMRKNTNFREATTEW